MKDEIKVKSNPVTVEVEIHFLCNLNNLLVDALGNSEILLTEHDDALGRTTKKNTHIAEMYEKEIKDLKSAIEKIKCLI